MWLRFSLQKLHFVTSRLPGSIQQPRNLFGSLRVSPLWSLFPTVILFIVKANKCVTMPASCRAWLQALGTQHSVSKMTQKLVTRSLKHHQTRGLRASALWLSFNRILPPPYQQPEQQRNWPDPTGGTGYTTPRQLPRRTDPTAPKPAALRGVFHLPVSSGDARAP